MLNISNELKNIYKNDIIPLSNNISHKQLLIHFPSYNLTISNDRIVKDSFLLEESLFSDKDISFGACEAAQVKFTLADVEQDLKGQVFTLTQIVNGVHTMPLGTYTVHSCIKQDDLRFKDIVAYDFMKKADIDVSNWYNSLSFPIILKSFRASLLSYLGIEEEIRDLPNDDMVITKTIQPTKLRGRDVLVCLEEINGCFGHISRLGKFTHVVLEPSYGLYPALTLFPSSDLYPVSENDTTFFQEGSESVFINYPMYAKVRFEEYTTKEITKLQIRQEAGDIGSIVGDGTNLYVIEGNFLLYGKGASELETIARNAFGNMQKRPYRPFESENIGLPYIEVGDTVSFETEANVASYVFRRTLKGIQALRDFFSATGSEEIEQSFSVNKEIKQLQGKTNVLVRNVDELSNTITDVEQELESKIIQTAESITQSVSQKYATKEYADNKISDYALTVTNNLHELQNQIDGNITSWFYDYVPNNTNVPAINWSTISDKNRHLGDLFYNTTTGYAYRYQVLNGIYSWIRITDTDVTKALADAQKAQDTADNKRRVFVTQPIPPYDIGDLWTQGSNGDLYKCKSAKSSGDYNSSDWEKATKYTDDTVANAVATEVVALDSKITQTAESIISEVSAKYTTKEEIVGQLPSVTLFPSDTLYPKGSVVSDLTTDYNSKIEQTSTSIIQEVTRATVAEGQLRSSITLLSNKIVLKVDSLGNIGYIELDGDPNTDLTTVKLKANNIELEGLVTANSNFKILADGSIEAVNGKFSGLVEGATIRGSAFETYANNGYFLSTAWDGNQYGNWNLEARIENGQIKVGRTNYHSTGGTFEVATTIDWNRIYSNNVHGTEISGVSADFATLEIGSVGLDGKIIFDSNYYFRPKTSSRTCYIGSSSYPWTAGYFKSLYVDGVQISTFDAKNISALFPQSNNNSYYAYLNTSREFIPNTSSSSYPFSLGNTSYPWDTIVVRDIRMSSSGGSLGFFGISPTTRKSVSKISNTSGAIASSNASKINEILTALASYGLLQSS